jgi:hypothetical protein
MSKTTNNVQNMLTSYGASDCADLNQSFQAVPGGPICERSRLPFCTTDILALSRILICPLADTSAFPRLGLRTDSAPKNGRLPNYHPVTLVSLRGACGRREDISRSLAVL